MANTQSASPNLITEFALHPAPSRPTCGATRFKWRMHMALPFVVPLDAPLNRRVKIQDELFDINVRNDVDQIQVIPFEPCPLNRTFLSLKLVEGMPELMPPPNHRLRRTPLRSAVEIIQMDEKSTPELYRDTKGVASLLDEVAKILSEIQRSLPFLHTGLVYSVFLENSGIAYQSVEHFCPKTGRWEILGSGFIADTKNRLTTPPFSFPNHEVGNHPHELIIIYEILAESQLAIERRMPRLALINGITAVELFSQNVFEKLSASADISARDEVEQLRAGVRDIQKFFLHQGLKKIAGRSLCDECKQLYNKFLEARHARHKTVHAGYEPDLEEAKVHLHSCYEVVQWLCSVAGFPIKPLEPPISSHKKHFHFDFGW